MCCSRLYVAGALPQVPCSVLFLLLVCKAYCLASMLLQQQQQQQVVQCFVDPSQVPVMVTFKVMTAARTDSC